MGNEAEESRTMCEAQDNAVQVKESENGHPGSNVASVESSREDLKDRLKETPIRLPLVQPTIPSICIEGSPYDTVPKASTSGFLSPPASSLFDLPGSLSNDWRDSGLGSTEGNHHGLLRRAVSVSFGDVTICGLLGEQGVGSAKTKRPILDDLPYIDDLILAAATPVLDNAKGRPKSLGQVLGALPEWLAHKSRLGSLSTISRSSSQDTTGDSWSLPRSVGGRQGKRAILRQMRSHRLAPGDYHPRVLQCPSASLGAFDDWKDVENPTLTVSCFPDECFVLEVLCNFVSRI